MLSNLYPHGHHPWGTPKGNVMTGNIKGGTSALEQEALSLFDQGIQVFLSDPSTKRGIGGHSEYDPILEREHVIQLCEDNPNANLEVVVGEDEGVVALGVGVGNWSENGEESFSELCEKHGDPETFGCVMPDGKRIYFFKHDTDTFKVGDRSGLWVDTVTHGYLVSPSTINGSRVEKIGTAETVRSLSGWLAGKAEAQGTPPSDAVITVGEAETISLPEIAAEVDAKDVPVVDEPPLMALRNNLTTWLKAGSDKTAVLAKALEWSRANGTVGIQDVVKAVEEITESITETAPLTPRDMLFKLADGMVLFHDNQDKPFFFYEGEAFSASSSDVSNRLTYHYLREMGDLPPKKELKAVLGILESRARFDGERIGLFNRVASSNDAILYDLRDRRYVKVSPKGWEVISSFPLFRRYQHMQPQLQPISGGDPWRVFDFLTVPEESRLLVMTYIISLFVPQIAHPVFAVYGDQGSSKSFFCTVINRLVDPTLTERVIQPKNERDLIQTLRQKYVTVLDNLSRIDNRVSDIFCQVCTGGSISYRQLYTDEGENIAQFRHVVLLNSIGLPIVNADLMDRSIILKLHRISPLDRKPEHELWTAFEEARPTILGGIFDTVSKAMAIYPAVEVELLPRLADFAKWGYSIAEALGMSGDKFLEDFSHNVKRQNESVVEKNVLCQAVLTLMADGTPYLAKVSEAHERLKSIAKQDAKDETFPKLPHHLRGELDRLRASLLEHGISFEFLERASTGVRVLFTKSDSSASQDNGSASGSIVVVKDEPDDAHEAAYEIPEVEFDEMPEVING